MALRHDLIALSSAALWYIVTPTPSVAAIAGAVTLAIIARRARITESTALARENEILHRMLAERYGRLYPEAYIGKPGLFVDATPLGPVLYYTCNDLTVYLFIEHEDGSYSFNRVAELPAKAMPARKALADSVRSVIARADKHSQEFRS